MLSVEYLLLFSGLIILLVCVLVGVAFLTLLERSVLGYIQLRKGPNKVGFWGLPQPFSDAVKLFTKECTIPLFSNYLVYYFSPVFSLFISLFVWICVPYSVGLFSFSWGILFFMCCLSVSAYSTMLAGWSSNSCYALLGALRAVAQTISYEVSLALVLMVFVFSVGGYNMQMFCEYQSMVWFVFMYIPLSMVWVAIMLAETNRTPFDFAEGESELVSGFNVEYSSGGFALIFLGEYASILFMSMLYVIMFMGGMNFSFVFYMKLLLMSFVFIWVRGTFPRYRYDKLMYLAWSGFLPLSLNYLMFIIGVKLFIYFMN